MFSFLFRFHFNLLLIFLLWLMYYLKVCYLISIYFRVSSYFLLLISSLIPGWFESRHRMISVLLNLSRCVLWPRMWFNLLNIPSELEKNVNSTVIVKVVYRCHLYPVDWWCWVSLCLSWFSDFLHAGCVHFLRAGYWSLQIC